MRDDDDDGGGDDDDDENPGPPDDITPSKWTLKDLGRLAKACNDHHVRDGVAKNSQKN